MGQVLQAGLGLTKRCLKPSGSVLNDQATFFGGKTLLPYQSTFHAILHTNILPTMQESHQSDSVCKGYSTK